MVAFKAFAILSIITSSVTARIMYVLHRPMRGFEVAW
jgi:hypothetical protein